MEFLIRRSLVVLAAAMPLAALAQTPAAHGAAARSPEKILATVDGKAVRLAAVSAEVNRILPMQSFHGTVPPEKIQEVARQALQTVIDNSLKAADAERRGVTATGAEVDQKLAAVKARFKSEAEFEARLGRAGLTLDALRTDLSRKLQVAKVEQAVQDEVETATVADARAYYDANVERFREPERAEVREILLKMPTSGRTEEQWKKREGEALAARARILSGEAFDALVKELSEAPKKEIDNGGLIGRLHRGQLGKGLDEPVWKLAPGEVSMPLRSFYGVHLFTVSRKLPPRQVPFEEMQAKLVPYLQKERRKERAEQWLAALRGKAKIEYQDPYFAPAQ